MAPQRRPHPNPRTCEYVTSCGKRDSAEEIKDNGAMILDDPGGLDITTWIPKRGGAGESELERELKVLQREMEEGHRPRDVGTSRSRKR